MAVLTTALTRLRADFNTRWPHRDKKSDGWIGDAAHQREVSGHNPDDTPGVRAEYSDSDTKQEVRAIDVDKDLGTSVDGKSITMLQVIQQILATPADRNRLAYIIHNRTIWTASSGWRSSVYTGSNPHTEHAHFSGTPGQDEAGAAWLSLANVGKVSQPPSGLPKYTNGTRVLKQGMTGTDVQFVQRFIGPARCGTADGIFGPNTTAGVKWYQDMRGLSVDGIVGPKTWAAMLGK